MNPRAAILLPILCLTACGNGAPTPSPQTQPPAAAPIAARAAAAQTISDGRTFIFTDPVYVKDGARLKFWAYGEPFAERPSGSYLVHAAGICVLLAGRGAEVTGVEESGEVAVGERGMIVANLDSARVAEAGELSFERSERAGRCEGNGPGRVCTRARAERNFYVKRIACKKRL